jgi:hypothetical protein
MEPNYPIDNNTYNLLQVLTSKLEAIEAYQRYQKDADADTRSFLEECLTSDRKSVQRAIELLRASLSGQATGELAGAGVR